jgi:hypothetical protein
VEQYTHLAIARYCDAVLQLREPEPEAEGESPLHRLASQGPSQAQNPLRSLSRRRHPKLAVLTNSEGPPPRLFKEVWIRRLVDEDLGRYSDFMIVFHQGNSRPLDAPTQCHRDSCLVEGRYFCYSFRHDDER